MNEYGTISLTETGPADQADAAGELNFELPNWGGQLPRAANKSIDQWLAYCRSNLPRLRESPGFVARRREPRVTAEFIL
jgi:hypothetical protein